MTVRSVVHMDLDAHTALSIDLEKRLIKSASTDTSITISAQDALMIVEHIKMALAWTTFIGQHELAYPEVDAMVGAMFRARIEAAFPGYPDQIVRQ